MTAPRLLSAALVATLALSTPVVAGEAEDYLVIVSPDVPVSNLSVDEVRRIFLFREKYWKAGLQVTIILSDEGLETGSLLLQKVYRMDYVALRRLILERLYQGEIDLAPKVVSSDRVAADYVAAGHGLITIARASAAQKKPVKILSVDGLAAGAPGYPLRK
ncbi:MAG: hypothetical protein HY049_11940 [Acidobacteria bacterium]|nr:hypothetical protein [Acidobacteriota bacterium]